MRRQSICRADWPAQVRGATSRALAGWRALYSRLDGWLSGRPALRYALPVAWMLLVFALSAQPTLPNAPGALADLLLKKTGHAVEYAVLLLLLQKAVDGRSPKLAWLGVVWLLTVAYAASDEYHQTFVPGRQGRVVDVVIDASGATLAALGVWRARRR